MFCLLEQILYRKYKFLATLFVKFCYFEFLKFQLSVLQLLLYFRRRTGGWLDGPQF